METPTFFEVFDRNYPKFKWFIEDYFPSAIPALERYRKEENEDAMIHMLNRIWYLLPDNRFNIIVNPKGWADFIELLEY